MRGNFIVDFEQPQLGRWQPREGLVYIAWENLPSRSIVQFDDVALRMLNYFHANLTHCRTPVKLDYLERVPDYSLNSSRRSAVTTGRLPLDE
jgi:hypothetical protein